MSEWLFNVYMDGLVQQVNAMVLGRGLELLTVNAKPAVFCSCYSTNR